MATNITSAPFSRAVVTAMKRLYPEHLADSSWDNTGLLLEAPFNPARRQRNSVLLTIDLTKAVADEAIQRKDSVVVAYHPIIFRGLKSLTLKDTQQQSLLRLAAAGISVYCPHTAVDAAPGGLGDWLADIVSGETQCPTFAKNTSNREEDSEESTSHPDDQDAAGENEANNSFTASKRPSYMLRHHPSQRASQTQVLTRSRSSSHERFPINEIHDKDHPGAGMGRIVRFKQAQPLSIIVERISKGVGNPKGYPIAIPQLSTIDNICVRAAAVCAGSGGSLFTKLPSDVDLLLTGELSHHEALAATESGKVVISLFHSNSERGFLHAVLRPQLEEALNKDWAELRQRDKNSNNEELQEALDDEEINVDVSEVDRDPYGLLIARTLPTA